MDDTTRRFSAMAATLFFAGLAALAVAGDAAAQDEIPLGAPLPAAAPCGAALLEDATADWLTDTPAVGDFTLDGDPDAVIWGLADGGLVLLVARCAGDRTVRTWRFAFEAPPLCDATTARVEAGSLLMEPAVVERVCAKGERRDECIHLRRENARLRARVAAGGREIRVVTPACMATTLRWDETLGGFVRLPR
jgi:hypothetical protein